MNNILTSRWATLARRLVVVFSLTAIASAPAVTLEDFGHQRMKVNGNLAVGARPLLVILLDLANTGNFAHSNAYYDNLVFNVFNTNSAGLRSVNGYMLVNSHARFSLTRAGVGLVGPLQLSDDQRTKARTNDIMRAGFAISAAFAGGFNFAPFDSNGDTQITSDEVLFLIIDNLNQADSGAARWANPDGSGGGFTPAGSTVSFSVNVGLMTQRVSFATLCHEFSHVLNTVDLYGGLNGNTVCYNYQYTLMSCTITRPDDMLIYGLDPWHKMQLGWVDPRIRSLSTGGVETIAAAQSISATNAPVILYDPARGPNEFFLVEYRTRTSPGGAGYEDDLPSSGLGIWHVVHNGDRTIFQFTNGVPTVWLEGQPDLQPGAQVTNQLWTSGTITPLLRWSDGTATATKIVVRNFNPGDGTLTFEWLTASDTWVDFQYNGTETGTFAQPFNTVIEGVNAVSRGGTVKFKQGGTSAEAPFLLKPLTLEAVGGAVTIGR